MKNLLTWLFAALVMGLLVVHETGMLEERFGPENSPGDRLLAAVPDSTEELVELRRVDLPRITWGSGRVESRREVLVFPELSGRILELELELGSRVVAGEVLATLDDEAVVLGVATAQQGLSLAESQVAAAEAGVAMASSAIASAGVELEHARTEHQRQKDLFAKKATTDQALLAAATREQAASVGVQSAQASMAAARAQVDVADQGTGLAQQALADAQRLASKAQVVAPIDGVVTQRLAEAGSMASPASPLVALRAADDLWVAAWFQAPPELGDEVLVRVGGRILGLLSVEEQGTTADPFTRSRAVRARLTGLDDFADLADNLAPGTFAELGVRWTGSSELLVPRAAVRRQGQVQSVRVSRDGRLVTRHVRTTELEPAAAVALGLEPGSWSIVRTGLVDGDQVAVAGAPR